MRLFNINYMNNLWEVINSWIFQYSYPYLFLSFSAWNKNFKFFSNFWVTAQMIDWNSAKYLRINFKQNY